MRNKIKERVRVYIINKSIISVMLISDKYDQIIYLIHANYLKFVTITICIYRITYEYNTNAN